MFLASCFLLLPSSQTNFEFDFEFCERNISDIAANPWSTYQMGGDRLMRCFSKERTFGYLRFGNEGGRPSSSFGKENIYEVEKEF